MKKQQQKQYSRIVKQKSNFSNKKNLSKKFISVRTGIRAGSGDDYGFTSCAIK